MTIHKEGYATLILLLITLTILNTAAYLYIPLAFYIIVFILSIGFFLFILQFFRSPKRIIKEKNEKLILSPADGKVVVIEETIENEYFKDKRLQVSIFMSPMNVHINWFPISGLIKYFHYHKGLFLVAWHPKSSTDNERTTLVIENEAKTEILLRQIAGAVARRIVAYPKVGDVAEQGAEFGFIKFGSRVDIFLPLETKINVKIGDKVTGKLSIIAQL